MKLGALSLFCGDLAKSLEPPTEYPWSPRFLVDDPDGRTVEAFARA